MGSLITSRFAKPMMPAFPDYKTPIESTLFNLKDLAINRFSNFRNAGFKNNLTVYIGGPDDNDTETDTYLEGVFDGVYFRNTDGKEGYDPKADLKLADIRMFISYNGAYLLQEAEKLETIGANEMAIFLEIPEGDIVSGNVLLIKAGDNVRQYAGKILRHKWVGEKYAINEIQIAKLLFAISDGKLLLDQILGLVEDVEQWVKGKLLQLGVDAAAGIADIFGKTLRLDEKRWNIDHPEYSFDEVEKDIVGFIRQGADSIQNFSQSSILPEWAQKIVGYGADIASALADALEEYKEILEFLLAYCCGLWNGLMDLLNGIFELIRLFFEKEKLESEYESNQEYYDALALEYVDNLLQAIMKLDWKETIIKSIRAYLDFAFYLNVVLPVQFYHAVMKANHTEVGYYFGYIVFNIVEFLLPPLKFAKLSKVAKLEKVIAILDNVGSALTKAGKKVANVAGDTFRVFMKVFDEFIAVINKGTENFVKFIEDVFVAIRKWIDDAVNAGGKLLQGAYNFEKRFMDAGGLKLGEYISTKAIFGQSESYTCVATSLRMVLESKGIQLAEREIAEKLGTSLSGAHITNIPKALNDMGLARVSAQLVEGSFDDFAKLLGKTDTAVVSVVMPGKGAHAMIIDSVKGGKVFLRDPLPLGTGSSYSMELKDFIYFFNKKAVIIK